MKELEHPAESLAADELPFRLADVIDGIDEFVIEPLVVSLGAIKSVIESFAQSNHFPLRALYEMQ